MKNRAVTRETRDAQVEDLRARLAEAEETLRAIRAGEVDALVVSTTKGNQVFTLAGADRIYRLLIETMNEGALTLAPDGTILYCNGCFAALLKKPLETIIGTPLRDYSAPSEQETLDALLRCGQTEASRGETWLRAADGSLAPVNLSVSALPEAETQDNLAVVVTDLTEQKRNEAIVAAEKLARSILEQAAEAILVCDDTGRITHASQAARRLCAQDPLLRPFGASFSLRLKDGTPFGLAAPLRGETLHGIQARLEWDSQACEMLVSAGPLRSSPDVIAGCIVTLTDISERIRMEQALQAKNEELQSQAEELEAQAEELRSQAEELQHEHDLVARLLETSPAGIMLVNRAGQITFANARAEQVLGLTKDAALGRAYNAPAWNITDYAGQPFPDEQLPVSRVLASGQPVYDVRHAAQWPDGRRVLLSINAAPVFDSSGRVDGVVTSAEDITIRVQAESQKEAALAKLKASLAEKEVLMREIYHRVKNNVQALIYLMDMQADYIADEGTRQMLYELRERAHAMALVHEKLYQSQNLAQIDFGDYLYDLVDNLSHAFGTGRSIVWRIEAASVLLSVDTAIPCGLIVSELLSNALKYAFPAGRPRAECGQPDCTISVASRVDGDRITLTVSDNGVGLPAEVDLETTKTLGLQLVGILARHQLGGQVEVDRSAGTTFKITFAERAK